VPGPQDGGNPSLQAPRPPGLPVRSVGEAVRHAGGARTSEGGEPGEHLDPIPWSRPMSIGWYGQLGAMRSAPREFGRSGLGIRRAARVTRARPRALLRVAYGLAVVLAAAPARASRPL